MRNNSARSYLPGQPDSFSAENMNPHIKSHLKRDRYGSIVNGFPVPANNEVQRNNGKRFCIKDETTDSNFSQLNQANEEMNQSHEQDMEIGYEETPPPPTYEGLEQRFKDEIMKLAGEQSDAENAEFIRHKERILEINKEYQEMLSALKAQQATRREEFLRQELQARLNQYHEDKRNQCSNMRVPDVRGYTGHLAAGEAIGRSHGAAEHKHDGEQAPQLPSWRSEGSGTRVILTAGEASGRLHGATEYNHDGGQMPPLPSWRSEETEARVASTARETIGRFHGATEYNCDGERSLTLPSGRGEVTVPLPREVRVPLPPVPSGRGEVTVPLPREVRVPLPPVPSGRGKVTVPLPREVRVPLPPGRVYNNRAVYH